MIKNATHGSLNTENININFMRLLQGDLNLNNNNNNENSENNLIFLRENTIVTNNNHKYRSGYLSYLINLIMNFFCYMFIYFFALYCFLPLDKAQLIKLLVKREKVGEFDYNRIDDLLIKKFKKLNKHLNANSFVSCSLAYIFEPIKSCKEIFLILLKILVINSQSDENIVEINDAEIDEIVSRIVYIYNPISIMEIFITLKVKDY